jgi:putative hydrolase of the HAD superfamily
MKSIRCLMLDMGGVLTQAQSLDKVDELMAMLGANCDRDAFRRRYFELRFDYDRGTIDGAEYWRRVARALGLTLSEGDIPKLISVDLESWFTMRPAMLEFLGGVKGRVGRLILLSNIHADGVRYIREGSGRPWAGQFHELVLSCEYKLLKPEREIYELAVNVAGVSPAETLFVDDNSENVAGAQAVGLSSFRFVDETDFFARLSSDYEFLC